MDTVAAVGRNDTVDSDSDSGNNGTGDGVGGADGDGSSNNDGQGGDVDGGDQAYQQGVGGGSDYSVARSCAAVSGIAK